MPDAIATARAGATEKQKAFASEFIKNGGNATTAAIKAGYNREHAYNSGYVLLRNETVQALIRSEQFLQLHGPLATIALSTLESAMVSDNVPWGVKVDAAKTVLDRAGVLAPKQPGGALPALPGGAADLDTLQAFIEAGSAALAARRAARAAVTVEQLPQQSKGELGASGEPPAALAE